MISGKVDKIEVKDDIGFHTIWENGVKTVYKMRVGVSWELRVSCTFTSTDQFWASAITYIRKDGKKGGKNCRFDYGGSNLGATFDFNMGTMPDKTVTFNRIKLWVTNYWTTGLPPEAQW